MTYRASLDSFARALTLTALFLILLPAGTIIYELLTGPYRFEHISAPLLVLALIVGLILFIHAFAPQSYSITERHLIINRPASRVILNLSDITEIQLLEKNALWGGIRLLGVGGMFGYYGIFWHKKYGRITLYATRSDNKILITFRDGKKILVTPDSLEMLDALKKAVSR